MSKGAKKETVGIVGCGGRGIATFICEGAKYGLRDRIVALCDRNAVRLNLAREKHGGSPALFSDYDAFLRDGKMDVVLIAAPDYLHCELAVKAFAAGKHVITEKPMAISVEQCDRMIAAARRAGRDLQVTFNLRYSPKLLALKTLVSRQEIGSVVAMEAQDVRVIGHGSDYFRRWHRSRDCSGGILVHKGCHTFDVLNWLADSRVASVYAQASNRFFLPRPGAGPRCKTCRIKDTCGMYVDLDVAIPTGVPWKGFDRELYSQAEHLDGYHRDQCVFGEGISIHDNIQIVARYENGIALTYNLYMFSPYATRSFVVRGTNGSIEADRFGFRLHPLFKGGVAEQRRTLFEPLPVQNLDPAMILGEAGIGKGTHGGADGVMMEHLLSDGGDDPSRAGPMEGRNAILLAEAAYRSIERGQPVDVVKEFGLAPR